MNIKKIKLPVEQATKEWKKYNELLKKRKEKYLKEMKDAMYQLKKGNELLDLYVVMENVGVDKNYKPKLAIARADWKMCHFKKQDTGRGYFSQAGSNWGKETFIEVPTNTFINWPRMKDREGKDTWEIETQQLKCKVPIIPAHIHPEDDLKNYYILWEVDNWEEIPKQDDPILLKRLTENLFVIIACWDVTELEQSIIRGM